MTSCSISFVYVLLDPDTKEVHYVGQTSRPKRRFIEHTTECWTKTAPSCLWIRSLLEKGKQPIQQIIQVVPYRFAYKYEEYWIQYYKEQATQLKNVLAAPGFAYPTTHRKYSTDELNEARRRMFERYSKGSGTSKYYGICKFKRYPGYSINLRAGKTRYRISSWLNERTAAEMYDALAKHYHKEKALLNFPHLNISPKTVEEVQLLTDRELAKSSNYRGVVKKEGRWMVTVTIAVGKSKTLHGFKKHEEELAAKYADRLNAYYKNNRYEFNFGEPENPCSIEEARIEMKLRTGKRLVPRSGYKGILWDSNRSYWYFLFETLDKKRHLRGKFQTPEQAVIAHNEYVVKQGINRPLLNLY